MGHARRRLVAGAVVGAVVASLLSACSGGSTALTDPHDLPPKRKGPPTDVSVCDLVPLAQASAALHRSLTVVGVGYGASRVPTFRCQLGDEFGVPRLTVELASGPVPIPWNVFLGAYGDRAGGDPKSIPRLGAISYLRNEKDESSLHVFVRGSILSLRLIRDPAKPVERRALLDIARLVVERLPRNPRLAGTAEGDRCSQVPDRFIGSVVGIEPSRAVGMDASDGSVVCSWASFPGSVDVTVVHDAARVAEYHRTVDAASYVAVRGAGPGITALSRSNQAGDLVLFDGDASMAFISVVPSAGYPVDSVITTPDEIVLARQVASTLM
ncbi:MAG TPA: hypothetical protein VLK34_03345 [Nocardioidaceae bacterium]|nr:hypothetical protein [Nocardioidaceae bacterium]